MRASRFVRTFRLENFKAVRHSGSVRFTPLTVLIGANGSGKSSLVEGIETYRDIVIHGPDEAFAPWFGFEHLWNKRSRHRLKANGRFENPMAFSWTGKLPGGKAKASMAVNALPGHNGYFIDSEEWSSHLAGPGERAGGQNNGISYLPKDIADFVGSWQFISLTPDRMGRPTPKRMAVGGRLVLNRDGSNLAQYLGEIREKDRAAFEGIVDAMRFVLDYARDFQPVETQEIQRTMYLQMTEGDFKIPGWMLSTGTVRVLALLAVLRNPDPPPLVVVEELENGLDPRTIHLVLDEIRDAVQAGRTQVIATTHSPYVLDLLPLQTVVLVERENGGDPVFWRPSDSDEVQAWAKDFAPGQLYAAGRFRREARS